MATIFCAVPGCERFARTRSLCAMHYTKSRRLGEVKPLNSSLRQCSVESCISPIFSKGYCSKHYQKWCKYRDAEGGVHSKGERTAFYIGIVLKYEHDDECLLWPFYRDDKGYAKWSGSPGEKSAVRVHRKLCIEVHGKPPFPKAQVAHSCGRGHLGCVTKKHLRWDTASGNMQDRVKHGTDIRGEKHPSAKLSEFDVREIRRVASGRTQTSLAEQFGVSRSLIGDIIRRRNWAWLD